MSALQSFGSRSRKLVGLDIAASSVKLVELSGAVLQGCRLERYAIEPLAQGAVADGGIADFQVVAEAVQRAVRRMGDGLRDVALALPASAVINKRIMLPANLRDQEMEFLVESEASRYIPFGIDEVNLDFHVLGQSSADPNDVEVLIAVARKDRVEDRVAVAEAAGLRAVVMDVEPFAAQAAFERFRPQLPGVDADSIVALLDFGATVMAVSMLRGGRQIYAREQAIGGARLTLDIARHYAMSNEEAEAAKKAGTLPADYERELISPFLDNVALEVSRALQFFFTSTRFNEVHHIALAGGSAVMPGLADVVARRTRVPCTVANPFAGMSLAPRVRPASLAAEAPGLLVACGLALRRFDA